MFKSKIPFIQPEPEIYSTAIINDELEDEDQVLENETNYNPNIPILPWKQTAQIITNFLTRDSLKVGRNGISLPITIPYGFQLVKTIPHPRSSLKSVIFIPQTTSAELFVSLDIHHINVWRGLNRIKRISTLATSVTESAGNLENIRGLKDIHRWFHIEKYKIYIAASSNLQLRILDTQFNLIYYASSGKPVLSLKYVPYTEEIITGEVGNIKVYGIEIKVSRSRDDYKLVERLIISDLQDDEWANFVCYEPSLNAILAAVDLSIHVYDFDSGKRINTIKNCHDMTVTVVDYYAPYKVF